MNRQNDEIVIQLKAPAGSKPRSGGGPSDLRCECGRLIARRLATGIELKCGRCKRVALIPLDWMRNR